MPELRFDFERFLGAVMENGLERTLKAAGKDLLGLALKSIGSSAPRSSRGRK